MGKLLKLLFSRAFLIGMLIAMQVFVLIGMLYATSTVSPYVFYVFSFISLCFVIYLFSGDQAGEYKLIWALVIIVFPLLGGLFYLLWGKRSTDWKALRKLHIIYEDTGYLLDKDKADYNRLNNEDPSAAVVSSYLTNITGGGLYKNCDAKYYPSGEDFFPDFLEELKKAKKFICMEYFIIAPGKMWDSVLKILKAKVKEGVEIYFMYDDAGSVAKVPNKYYKKLQNMGIKAVKFNHLRPRMYTLMNYRDHRKITVIDGKVAFTGGLNLADEYINEIHPCGYWKDTAVKIKGDVVWELTVLFFQLWCFESKKDVDIEKYRYINDVTSNGYVQFFGDDPLDSVNVSEDTYISLINRAQKYIYIATPYLIIDSRMLGALQTAARSGIDVRIITPGIPDKKTVFYVTQSYYKILIDAGVRIFEFTPGFLHAKSIVTDDDIAIVGTVNMDYRSLYLHFECAAVFYKHSIVNDVKQDMLQTFKQCKEITETDIENTFVLKRLFQAIMRMFAPLM